MKLYIIIITKPAYIVCRPQLTLDIGVPYWWKQANRTSFSDATHKSCHSQSQQKAFQKTWQILKGLRHYLRAQSHGHHTSDRLEERGVKRGSARRSPLEGRERAVVSQTKLGPFQRQRWVNFWEMRWSAYMGFSERIDTILNSTELNWNIHQPALYYHYYLSFCCFASNLTFLGRSHFASLFTSEKQSWPNTYTHIITCVTHAGLFSHDVTNTKWQHSGSCVFETLNNILNKVKFEMDCETVVVLLNNNVHLSCAHQRPERSHDTY